MKHSCVFVMVCALLAGRGFGADFDAPPETVEDINVAGLGVGLAPDYMGSSRSTLVLRPELRFMVPDSRRYFLLLGPQASLNVLDDENWRMGPTVNFRGARGGGVDDEVVKQMDSIAARAELGAFVAYRLKLSAQKLHHINFAAEFTGSDSGMVGGLRTTYWKPLRLGTIFNVGAHVSFASDRWMNKYFGVQSENDIGLFPSLGGQAYDAEGSMKSVSIPISLTQALSRDWMVSVGVRYERLFADARNSPIVLERGSADQWMLGVGILRLF